MNELLAKCTLHGYVSKYVMHLCTYVDVAISESGLVFSVIDTLAS